MWLLGSCPVTRWQARWVTGVCPSQKPLVMVTSCAGLSSPPHPASPGEQPTSNFPGGIQTNVSPSFGFAIFV
ncbi:MAG TPA: hypothetical protein VKF41_11190, partial [Bryobacteraceae bacterium]|nr:hypothetical protein [Bryobacteraceae bacterium]